MTQAQALVVLGSWISFPRLRNGPPAFNAMHRRRLGSVGFREQLVPPLVEGDRNAEAELNAALRATDLGHRSNPRSG